VIPHLPCLEIEWNLQVSIIVYSINTKDMV
jgi:hypothetical protein